MKIVIVSGGFDPVHVGHVLLFEEARALGDRLWVIMNNDNWLMVKKGFVFMPEGERKYILSMLKPVNQVMCSFHQPNTKRMSVENEIETLVDINPKHTFIFANGGDRKEDNIPEYKMCDMLGVEMVFGVGGDKIQSSSELVKKAVGK